MRDLHCHILPGVDDGARNLDESLAMLEAAKAAGITSIAVSYTHLQATCSWRVLSRILSR